MENGLTSEESIIVSKMLEEAGIDGIEVTGGNRNFDVMDELLNSSNIEYFELGRPMISDHNLIKLWSTGNYKKPKCVSCNQCYNIYGKRCILNQKK